MSRFRTVIYVTLHSVLHPSWHLSFSKRTLRHVICSTQMSLYYRYIKTQKVPSASSCGTKGQNKMLLFDGLGMDGWCRRVFPLIQVPAFFQNIAMDDFFSSGSADQTTALSDDSQRK